MEILVRVIQPVLPDRAEHVELERILEGFRLVLDPGRDVQHLAFAHGDLFAADHEFQGALQDVRHLLALVRVHRDQAAALQIDLGEHLTLARHDLPRQHFSHFLEGDLIPAMETDGLGAHAGRAYTIRPGCYNSLE